MPNPVRAALVTGATRGIGYSTAKHLLTGIPNMAAYLTSRNDVKGLDAILGLDIGYSSQRATFARMDVREQDSIFRLRDQILRRNGGLDILVNNAAVYLHPDHRLAVFPRQVETILGTNYWGLKSVVKTFQPHLRSHSRIVNMTSNLGAVNQIAGDSEGAVTLRRKFSSMLDEDELDDLMKRFQQDAESGKWKDEGWPTCAYTVSKMAVNAYTRILQYQLDCDDNRRDMVVNAVYAGTFHSRITQTDEEIIDTEEGARSVFHIATVARNSQGVFPRGQVIWNNFRVVDDVPTEDIYPWSRKQLATL